MQLFVRQIYSPLDLINMNFPIPQFEQIHKSATRPAQCNTCNYVMFQLELTTWQGCIEVKNLSEVVR